MDLQSLRRGFKNLNLKKQDASLEIAVQEEKDVIEVLKKLEKEKTEAAQYLAVWGKKDSPDIGDIFEKLAQLADKLGEAFTSFINQYSDYREILKHIKSREDDLFVVRKRHHETSERLKSFSKSGRDLTALESELNSVESELLDMEARQISEKRKKLQDAINLQSDSWTELAGKITIIATFSKFLAEQIPQGTLAPGQELPEYTGSKVTAKIYSDCCKSLENYGKSDSAILGSSSIASKRTSKLELDATLPRNTTQQRSSSPNDLLLDPPRADPYRPPPERSPMMNDGQMLRSHSHSPSFNPNFNSPLPVPYNPSNNNQAQFQHKPLPQQHYNSNESFQYNPQYPIVQSNSVPQFVYASAPPDGYNRFAVQDRGAYLSGSKSVPGMYHQDPISSAQFQNSAERQKKARQPPTDFMAPPRG